MIDPSSEQETLIARLAPVAVPRRVERAARALFARDCARSIGLASARTSWPRVADEYRKQAEVALAAADEEPDA